MATFHKAIAQADRTYIPAGPLRIGSFDPPGGVSYAEG